MIDFIEQSNYIGQDYREQQGQITMKLYLEWILRPNITGILLCSIISPSLSLSLSHVGGFLVSSVLNSIHLTFSKPDANALTVCYFEMPFLMWKRHICIPGTPSDLYMEWHFKKKKKKDCWLLDKVRLRNMKAKSREVIITKEKRKLIHVTVFKSKLFSIAYIHIVCFFF